MINLGGNCIIYIDLFNLFIVIYCILECYFLLLALKTIMMNRIAKVLGVIKYNISYVLVVVIFAGFYSSQINNLDFNKLPFLLSYFRFYFFMSVIAFWISFLVRRFYHPYENNKNVSNRHLSVAFYVIVFLTALLAKILFSIQPHLSFNGNLEVIQLSMFKKYYIYLIVVMLFAYWLKNNPHKNLYLSKLETTPSTAEAYLDLFSLYDHLIRSVKRNHKIDNKNFTLFDIVFIYVESKIAIIYLRDGSKIHCDKIVEILQKLELIHWLVKISQNCYVNVMHITYPNYKDGQYLILQSDTNLSMSSKKMTKREVKQLCQFGSYIGDKNIKTVIKNKSDLDYRGQWDALVKLN